MNLNKVVIIGRMARDPELKTMPSSGNSVTNFAVATNESYKNKQNEKVEKAEFHNVVVYGSVAENCAKYLRKGQLVMIEGKIATRTWDKEDGSKGYKTEIIAFSVQFGPKSGQGAPPEGEYEVDAVSGDVTPARRKTTQTQAVVAAGQKTSDDQIEYPAEEINPDDIPF